MLYIILFIVAGIPVGYFLRNSSFVKKVDTFLTAIIVLLLFFLGVSVGSNEQVITNFGAIGFDAFILTIGGTLGSVLCAWWVYETYFKRRKDKK